MSTEPTPQTVAQQLSAATALRAIVEQNADEEEQ